MIHNNRYFSENELINWQFVYGVGRAVESINLLDCVYYSNDASLPVASKLITKPIKNSDISPRKIKRQSDTTSNEYLISILEVCQQNQLQYRNDQAVIWFH